MKEDLSDSKAQKNIEEFIINQLTTNSRLFNLLASQVQTNTPLVIEKSLNKNKMVEFDLYDAKNKIAVEIYSRPGKSLSASNHKISNDVFKMIFFENLNNTKITKIIIFAFEDMFNSYENSDKWISKAIKHYDIKLLCVEEFLPSNLKLHLHNSRKKQARGNKKK